MTGYQSKKKVASAKTIDEVNWVDHEPDGRRAAQEPVANDRALQLVTHQLNHWVAYATELRERLNKYEGGAPMLLNTAPPKRKPLTDEQIKEISESIWGGELDYRFVAEIKFARAIEAAHGIKEKNNGT